ncbi:hypothetical protein SAMN05421771_1821 [Granulicella pectinivorans]|jgi:hypothetical protein|uniref:Uncharacterized protein n=1 Tax=Granulicella pectinivorans TaxID=474950 RepID=A0A1I6M4H7_9BACT|nr:hypothetical protein [Granulicella pectinivorans]SFS10615.1 hypothetical protein SAMN05421771_1821 [Granulicella pectinivorans]
MSELNPMALAREFYSRATPYRLLKRVAGIAFNFSSVSLEAYEQQHAEKPAEAKPRMHGLHPAFPAL